MNLISMDKKYRRRGGTEPVRVLCVDAYGVQPVVYLNEENKLSLSNTDGRFCANGYDENDEYDLVEYIEPKMVPLGPEDIPIGSALKHKTEYTDGWCLITAIDSIQVTAEDY